MNNPSRMNTTPPEFDDDVACVVGEVTAAGADKVDGEDFVVEDNVLVVDAVEFLMSNRCN